MLLIVPSLIHSINIHQIDEHNYLVPLFLKRQCDRTLGKYPYGPMSDDYSHENGASGNAIEMFSSAQLPVKAAVAKHFAVFNNRPDSARAFKRPSRLPQ